MMPFSGNVHIALEGCCALQWNTVSARFDNLSATGVPEPSSLLMLLTGLVGAGGDFLCRGRTRTVK